MLLEVCKCIKKTNAPCLHNLFNTNIIPYQLRTSRLEQPLHWNNEVWAENFLLCRITFMEFCFKWSKWYCSYWFQWIQEFLNIWKGSAIFQYAVPLLWWFPVLWVVYLMVFVVYWISLLIFYRKFTCIFLFYDRIFTHCTVYICTLQPYTSILANVICFPYDWK